MNSARHPTEPIGRIVRSEALSRWLVTHRVWVLGVATLLALFAGWRTVLTYAALRSDLEELLPTSAPSVRALDTVRERLPGLRHLGIVVDTGGRHNVAAANRFIDELQARVREYPPTLVEAVRADIRAEREFAETYALQLMEPGDVRKLRDAVEARRDWEVTQAMDLDLLDEDEQAGPPKIPVDDLKAKYEKRYGKPHAFPDDRFVSDDGSTVVLLIQASSHGTSYETNRQLLTRVENDIAALGFPGAYASGMRVGYAGDVATQVEEMEGLAADLTISGVLVLTLVVGIIVWFFRSFRALPILGIPLLYGTVYAFGLAALPPFSIRHLNSNTAFLGSIVVGNGINSGIILLARFREERGLGFDLDSAIARAVSGTWRPTLAAALAASAAYGSLVFTDFRGFNQFGWIGGFGMVLCWGAAMLLGPPLISLVGERMRAPAVHDALPSLWTRTTAWFLARPRTVLATTLVLSAVSFAGLSQRSSDWMEYDFSKLRRRDSWESGERYWGKRMDQTLRRYLTPTVVMADTAEHARLVEERVKQLKADGQAGELIASVRSATSALPATRDQSAKEARELSRVLTPKLMSELSEDERQLVERALSPKALEPVDAKDVPHVLLAGLREHDGRVDRNVLVFPKLSEGTWDARRMQTFTEDLREAATVDGKPLPVAGSLLLSSDIASAMRADGPRATALALLAVLVICLSAFRSRHAAAFEERPRFLQRALGLSLAAVGSLFVGVLLMLGAMAWLGERLNFSNFVALPITFGIGADYSINMLKRYQAEGKLDLRSALANTGGAVALCSATTIIGFGSLLVAQNQALFSFGVFAVAGELACLLTAILALPAVLSALSPDVQRASFRPRMGAFSAR